MIKALLFDMDGVILDSLPLHIKIWKEILDERGIKLSKSTFERYNGSSTPDIAKRIVDDYKLDIDPKSLVAEKKIKTIDAIDKNNLLLYPDARRVLQSVSKKYKIALATSATIDMLKYLDKSLDFLKYFETYVYAELVKTTKPDPALFLLGASRLGVDPKYCCVIEDAPNGIEAAKKGGMYVIALKTTTPASSLGDADQIIASLSELEKSLRYI